MKNANAHKFGRRKLASWPRISGHRRAVVKISSAVKPKAQDSWLHRYSCLDKKHECPAIVQPNKVKLATFPLFPAQLTIQDWCWKQNKKRPYPSHLNLGCRTIRCPESWKSWNIRVDAARRQLLKQSRNRVGHGSESWPVKRCVLQTWKLEKLKQVGHIWNLLRVSTVSAPFSIPRRVIFPTTNNCNR